jgi:hypothetical protein
MTWYGNHIISGEEHRAAGFARNDGALAMQECARVLSERLGAAVEVGHLLPIWVDEPETSVGALKGLVGGGDRP